LTSTEYLPEQKPMFRLDKLTTRFQQALADAQSLAVGQDHQFIEPVHVLSALLDADDGGTKGLLARAGANLQRVTQGIKDAISRLPQVQGTGGQVQIGRDLMGLLNLTDKEAQKRNDQFIASELFLLAAVEDKGDTGRLLRDAGLTKKTLVSAIDSVRGGEACRMRKAKAAAKRSKSLRWISPSVRSKASLTR
jgi:ATP-dependent Clp protease ATP-binding subunit ClpB